MGKKIYLLAILFILVAQSYKVLAQVNTQDSLALVDFYNNTGGANWTYHTNWLTYFPVSTWTGVTVTDGRVTVLNLSDNNLYGDFGSADVLSNLSALTELDIASDSLKGSIPASLGNLKNLTILELYSDELSDTIPSSFGNLTNLITLELSANQLTGNIPSSLGNLSNLQFLHLEYNQLTGSIPSSLSNLSNLIYLELSNNQLTGGIPASLGNLSNLNSLSLSGNPLGGSIPSSLGNLSKLYYLGLEQDDLSGSIPTTLGNLSPLLTTFDVGFNNLSGSIPPSIFSNYPNIDYFLLNNNQLSGTVPPPGNFSNLIFFNLANNQFTFSGMEAIAQTKLNWFSFGSSYSFQATIRLNQYGSLLSVSAGGTLANDTFRLYRNGVLDSIQVGDSIFNITAAGSYSITVTNSIATQLTLYSDTVNATSISVQLCNNVGNDSLYSNLIGTNYIWQVNTGNGFTNVVGNGNGNIPYLGLENVQSSMYGYQYRCIVNGDTSDVYTLQFKDTWTGIVDSIWENPLNWSCGTLPDLNTDVFINSGTAILGSNTAVRSLTVSPAANFIIITGNNIVVTH